MSNLPALDPFSFPEPVETAASLDHLSSDDAVMSDTTQHKEDGFFPSPGLAPSPEHPYFGAAWPTKGQQFDQPQHGLDQTMGIGGNHLFTNQDISSFTNDLSLDSFPWQTTPGAPNGFDMSFVQQHALSHTSSTSSLNSLTSSTDPSQGGSSNNGLLVELSNDHVEIPISRTRQSSYNMEKSPEEAGSMNMWTMPTMIPTNAVQQYIPLAAQRDIPALQLQTQGLGRAVPKTKSATRLQPYLRERSTSLSVKSEADEDISALLTSMTSESQQQTPWSTISAHPLVGGVHRMTLHHRRTSSNVSSFSNKASPMRPSLARAHRSSSLIMSKKNSNDALSIRLTGSAEERENTVRTFLNDRANEYKGMTSGNQQDKARGVWVRSWLQLSYTASQGSTVPRQGLYHSYTLSCEEYGVQPINSASFGKAVRAAYPGIKTRRLGHRGNSKYHYVALRPAIRIEALRLNEYGDSSGRWHVAPEDGTMGFHPSNSDDDMEGEEVDDTEIEEEEEEETFTRATIKKTPSSIDLHDHRPIRGFARRHTTSVVPSSRAFTTPVYNLRGFPIWQNPHCVSPEARAFWEKFCQHQESLAASVRSLRFDQLDFNCRTFWAGQSPVEMHTCQQLELSTMINTAMASTYDHILSILLEKLVPSMPTSAQSALRSLAQNLESIIEDSMTNFSPEFCEPKIELSVRAGHLLQRFADIHQLTTALTPILSSQDQMRTMLASWDRLDTRAVSDQCALSCNCQPSMLLAILDSFHGWLLDAEQLPSRGHKSIEKLGKWVEGVLGEITQSEGIYDGGVPRRSIIVKSGFITSQIMRDFTLKSDPAFGLFQLIKTWVDDWISLWVLRHTALTPSSLDVQASMPQMSVMIPSQIPTFANDLTTAVPSQSTMAGPNALPNYELQSQFLTMPTTNNLDANTPRGFGSVM